jgi:AraC-like DNA-binding protein
MSYALHALAAQLTAELRKDPSLTLEVFCQRINVERHSIERALRQTTGYSFREIRRGVLLDLARELLAHHPNLSVKEIALRLGYQSAQAFARAFKKSTGHPPHDFRGQIEI